jgi:U3 small nucleolar RNA-associated protein 15
MIRENEGGEGSWRILTAGLDGLVRIHTWNNQTGEVRHIHGVKLSSSSSDPITSMGVNETHDRLAIGTSTGYVMVRQRGPSVTQSKRKREPRAGTYAHFTRGMNVTASDADHVLVSHDRKRKLPAYDLALKQFRYGDALDDALNTRNPQAVRHVQVCVELFFCFCKFTYAHTYTWINYMCTQKKGCGGIGRVGQTTRVDHRLVQ